MGRGVSWSHTIEPPNSKREFIKPCNKNKNILDMYLTLGSLVSKLSPPPLWVETHVFNSDKK